MNTNLRFVRLLAIITSIAAMASLLRSEEASKPPKPADAAVTATATATVYVYRWQDGASLVRYPVFVDGSQIANLKQERYARVEVPAGKHVFRSKSDAAGLTTTLDMEPGKEYYLKVEIMSVGHTFRPPNRVVKVDPETGKSDVSLLKREVD